jgi:Spy/CpxP family protein refolding chaperone
MTSINMTVGLLGFALGIQIATAQTADSPYVGQEDRAIKALSAQDVEGLLAGRGMGYAKAAELNGYPGPMHVLELAEALHLTSEQTAATRAIEATMRSEAKSLGVALVEAEKRLDALFASKRIDERLLDTSLREIGSIQTRLRQSHLRAHLAQARVLDAAQTERYFALRGYSPTQNHHAPSTHEHH